ncbi:MAG TPA: hypothetical protein PLQ88_17975, partial [Blastocatellia bacterium]|nr:hypothetical protein [Blastocatellia bacterium]
MILPEQTGWLARDVTPESLARLLELALSDLEQGVDLRHDCRRFAENQFNFARQAQLYTTLFSSLLVPRP